MKVLFISNDPTIFDAMSASHTRMRAYAALMGELHILSSADKDAKEEQEGNLFLHPVHTLKLFRVRALAERAHALILKHTIEIVSAQDPFEHGLAALRAVRGTQARLHIQVHTDFLSPWFIKGGTWRTSFLNRYRRRIADRVLSAADGIRTVSERVRSSLIARYGSRPSEMKPESHGAGIPEPSVIPVAIDSQVPTPVPLPAHLFTFSLIAVGRLEPEKRIEDILLALKLIPAHYSMIGLFIIGAGSQRRTIERKARRLGLTDKVIFLGERYDARALMASAQAFIQASAYEGYSRTLVEAALARVPIITTNVGIVGEVFKENEDVLAAPVADPIALSLNIIRFVEDTSLRLQLPIHAKVAARAHLAAQGNLVQRIRDDLQHVLQNV